MCDAAEIAWGELEDRRETQRLLAIVARGLGATGLGDFQPASVRLSDELYEAPPSPRDRRMQVMAFVERAGGGG